MQTYVRASNNQINISLHAVYCYNVYVIHIVFYNMKLADVVVRYKLQRNKSFWVVGHIANPNQCGRGRGPRPPPLWKTRSIRQPT